MLLRDCWPLKWLLPLIILTYEGEDAIVHPRPHRFCRQRAVQLTVEIAQHAGVEQFIVGFDGRGTGGGDALLQ